MLTNSAIGKEAINHESGQCETTQLLEKRALTNSAIGKEGINHESGQCETTQLVENRALTRKVVSVNQLIY